MSVVAALIIALPAQGSAETKKTTITVMKPGDLWLDDVQYTKVARGQRDGTWGYEITYVLPGIGEKVLFWPRSKIDLDGSAPNKYRVQTVPRGKGRILLPDRITTKSLPDVYRAILMLEGSYSKEARGNMVVAEAFATVTGLAAGLPGRAAAGVASRPAASSAATRAPVRPTVARPTAAESVATPTGGVANTAKGAASGLANQTRAQLLKSKGSYEKLIAEHQQKLAAYRANPLAHDNLGTLAKAPEHLRTKIIEGRIKALEGQIRKQQGELRNILERLGE